MDDLLESGINFFVLRKNSKFDQGSIDSEIKKFEKQSELNRSMVLKATSLDGGNDTFFGYPEGFEESALLEMAGMRFILNKALTLHAKLIDSQNNHEPFKENDFIILPGKKPDRSSLETLFYALGSFDGVNPQKKPYEIRIPLRSSWEDMGMTPEYGGISEVEFPIVLTKTIHEFQHITTHNVFKQNNMGEWLRVPLGKGIGEMFSIAIERAVIDHIKQHLSEDQLEAIEYTFNKMRMNAQKSSPHWLGLRILRNVSKTHDPIGQFEEVMSLILKTTKDIEREESSWPSAVEEDAVKIFMRHYNAQD